MTGTLLGINKTENERLLTKWLENQIYVCVKTVTVQHSVFTAIQKIFLLYSIFPKTD
jgi:hypothetical protein